MEGSLKHDTAVQAGCVHSNPISSTWNFLFPQTLANPECYKVFSVCQVEREDILRLLVRLNMYLSLELLFVICWYIPAHFPMFTSLLLLYRNSINCLPHVMYLFFPGLPFTCWFCSWWFLYIEVLCFHVLYIPSLYFVFVSFLKIFLLFNYSCMPFLPIPPPHPSQTPLPLPRPPSPLILSMCPL